MTNYRVHRLVSHVRFDRRCGLALGILAAMAAMVCPGGAEAVEAEVAEAGGAVDLQVAGNDEILWTVVGQWNSEASCFFYRFAQMDKTATQLRAAARILPQKGHIKRVAVVGESLHVFFGKDAVFAQDGAHYSYNWSGGYRELPLPGPVMPEAVAGAVVGSRPRLWAVVDRQTAAKVLQAQKERAERLGTQPAEGSALDGAFSLESSGLDIRVSASDGSAFHLVQYDGVAWYVGFAAPDECADAKRFWLCLGEGRMHLLWEDPAARVHYAWREKDRWVPGPTLDPGGTFVRAYAGLINRELTLALLDRDPEPPHALQPEVWTTCRAENDTWQWKATATLQAAPPIQNDPDDPDEPDVEAGPATQPASATGELMLSQEARFGGFLDKLAVVQRRGGGAELAFYSPVSGGQPIRRFQEVPLAMPAPELRRQRGFRDFVATLIVAAVLLLVFWRRQESISSPIPLPAGILVVGPGKRALAAIIDMLPASFVVSFFWQKPLETFSQQFWAAFSAGDTEAMEALQTPPELIWAWGTFLVAYTLYCIGFEVFWRATPGKRLLNCEVKFETLENPNAIQFIIRNVTKVIELLPYLQIWPFMLVVFFTRNHQRVGDLLARTIVVERQFVVMEGPDEDIEDETPESPDEPSDPSAAPPEVDAPDRTDGTPK